VGEASRVFWEKLVKQVLRADKWGMFTRVRSLLDILSTPSQAHSPFLKHLFLKQRIWSYNPLISHCLDIQDLGGFLNQSPEGKYLVRIMFPF
jgi:hypothetical protein